MAIANFKATVYSAVASTLTLSPYIANTDVVKKAGNAAPVKGTWFPTMGRGTLQIVRITALALAIISTAGFIAAMAVPSLAIPVFTLGSAALLTMGICLFAYSIFANQKKPDDKTAQDTVNKPVAPISHGPNSQVFRIEVREPKEGNPKGKEKVLNEKEIEVSYYRKDEVRVSRVHQITRIAAVALVIIAALGIATATLTTLFAFAPLLVWAPLIAFGSTIACASGVSIFALSILTVYNKQRIPTDKHVFDDNGSGTTLRHAKHQIQTTLGPLEKPENVYLTRTEYKKYLDARALLAKNTRETGGLV